MKRVKDIIFPFVNILSNSEERSLETFQNHYFESRDFVRSSIYWMTHSDDIDDLVQEAYLKAWKSYSRFKGDSNFKTWIYRIAMNVTYTHLKKKKKLLSDDFTYDLNVQNESDKENADLIAKGLMTLSFDQRQAFTLHFQQGFTYEELSSLLDIPEGTAKSRISNGKKKFVAFLKENGVDYER